MEELLQEVNFYNFPDLACQIESKLEKLKSQEATTSKEESKFSIYSYFFSGQKRKNPSVTKQSSRRELVKDNEIIREYVDGVGSSSKDNITEQDLKLASSSYLLPEFIRNAFTFKKKEVAPEPERDIPEIITFVVDKKTFYINSAAILKFKGSKLETMIRKGETNEIEAGSEVYRIDRHSRYFQKIVDFINGNHSKTLTMYRQKPSR